jgi:hypothetical protein
MIMKRVTLNAPADIGCLIIFLLSLITGLVLFLSCLQEGTGGGRATNLGITRLDRVNLNNYTSLAFAPLLILHILLHWRFSGISKKLPGMR